MVLSSVTPPDGPEVGGQTVTLVGQFGASGDTVQVTFDGVSATQIVHQPTQITCVTPARTASGSAVDVVVSSVPRGSVTAVAAYTFQPST